MKGLHVLQACFAVLVDFVVVPVPSVVPAALHRSPEEQPDRSDPPSQVDDCIGRRRWRRWDAVGGPTAHASRPTLSGWASVVDGDTLDVGEVRIRLFGVDAPESRQSCVAGGRRRACGERATRALGGLVGGRTVSCEERDRDRYGRIVAVCSSARRAVNAWMVSRGLALAYQRYSRDYVGEEASAYDAGLGMWRGNFVPPWDWQRGERLAGSRHAPKSAVGSVCRIKGDISRDWSRIYHVAGRQFYERHRIDTSRGERWFCTEFEARAAGWRRSRQ